MNLPFSGRKKKSTSTSEYDFGDDFIGLTIPLKDMVVGYQNYTGEYLCHFVYSLLDSHTRMYRHPHFPTMYLVLRKYFPDLIKTPEEAFPHVFSEDASVRLMPPNNILEDWVTPEVKIALEYNGQSDWSPDQGRDFRLRFLTLAYSMYGNINIGFWVI